MSTANATAKIPQMLPPKYRKCYRQKIKKHLVEYSRMPRMYVRKRPKGVFGTSWRRDQTCLWLLQAGNMHIHAPMGSRSSHEDA